MFHLYRKQQFNETGFIKLLLYYRNCNIICYLTFFPSAILCTITQKIRFVIMNYFFFGSVILLTGAVSSSVLNDIERAVEDSPIVNCPTGTIWL